MDWTLIIIAIVIIAIAHGDRIVDATRRVIESRHRKQEKIEAAKARALGDERQKLARELLEAHDELERDIKSK